MPQPAPSDSRDSGREVHLDHTSLRGDASGGDTRYSVGLQGAADSRWADTCIEVQESSVPHRRFQLDRRTRTFAFTCPTIEGPAYVFEMLDRLEELLERVERRLAVDRTAPGALPPGLALRPIA